MGRQEPSAALAPQAYRKEQRAKNARTTINKLIPALLVSDARARKGVERAELIIDPEPISSLVDSSSKEIISKSSSAKRKGKVMRNVEEDGHNLEKPQEISQAAHIPLEIKISVTDTLFAAHALHELNPRSKRNVAILNMASPLRPGGGVLNGATSQEESLCVRSTLLPSLKEEWYRLPEIGGVWSPDVCVFRLPNPATMEDDDLGKGERFYVDVISAGMLRFPEVITKSRRKSVDGDDVEEIEDEEEKSYASEQDREMAVSKIRAVMRILQAKKAERIVLGAWGCGAYGNPVEEIAAAWKRVLLGSSRSSKRKSKTPDWSPLKEIVFAIKDRRMAEDFAACCGSEIKLEGNVMGKRRRQFLNEDDDRDLKELQEKVRELELQIPQVKTPLLRTGLEETLQALRLQLAAAGDVHPGNDEDPEHNSEEMDEDIEVDDTEDDRQSI
jgi:hypothetical protein